MRRFIVLLLITMGMSVQDNALAYPTPDPDLYLDGVAFADTLGADLIARYPRDVLREDFLIPVLLFKLQEGAQFSRSELDHPLDSDIPALLEWILSKKNHSVTPLALYTHAIDLKRGNVLRALMLLWDVLRKDYNDFHQRNYFPVTLKLVDITGELEYFEGTLMPLSGFIRGDNYSAWYHFVGTAILGFAGANSRMRVLPDFALRARARVVLALESNHWANPEIAKWTSKRHTIDLAGFEFGQRLSNIFDRYRQLAPPRPYLYTDARLKSKNGNESAPLKTPESTVISEYLKWEPLIEKGSDYTPEEIAEMKTQFNIYSDGELGEQFFEGLIRYGDLNTLTEITNTSRRIMRALDTLARSAIPQKLALMIALRNRLDSDYERISADYKVLRYMRNTHQVDVPFLENASGYRVPPGLMLAAFRTAMRFDGDPIIAFVKNEAERFFRPDVPKNIFNPTLAVQVRLELLDFIGRNPGCKITPPAPIKIPKASCWTWVSSPRTEESALFWGNEPY